MKVWIVRQHSEPNGDELPPPPTNINPDEDWEVPDWLKDGGDE